MIHPLRTMLGAGTRAVAQELPDDPEKVIRGRGIADTLGNPAGKKGKHG